MYHIKQTQDTQINTLYEIVRQWPEVWTKDLDSMGYLDFVVYFKSSIVDSVVAVGDDEKDILAWAYTAYLQPKNWCDMVVFRNVGAKSPDFLNLAHDAMDYFFNTHELKAIRAFIREDNLNALNIMELLGFKEDGTLRSYKKINEVWKNYIIHSLLNEERSWLH